jgi:NAD(P) transhydrogenase subunit alpha
MPTIFIPKETVPGETRVAAVPETVKKLVKAGYTVKIEKGAGAGSHFPDSAYQKAGATIAEGAAALYAEADVVAKLHPPRESEPDQLKSGGVVISFLNGFQNQDLVKKLAERNVTAFAMEMVPRITRAQSMDALSSQANIAGYKAVVMAADALGKLFPLMMTAAGTIQPGKVVILGAGVAGLQAIATAKRLGAVVEVSDVRIAVKEQVQSLGGKFIEVEGMEDMETEGGYAKEASEDFLRRQREIVARHMAAADVVIATAQVMGKKAPILVPAKTVEEMKDGAVIVDLAVEQGGNCELSEPGQVVEKHGVTIIGKTNVPALCPVDASEMYAKNILNVVNHLTKEGAVNLDFEDEITKGSVVTHGGKVVHPMIADALGGKS